MLVSHAVFRHIMLGVRYKTWTGPGPGLVIKRGPGLFIKHGLMDCMYAMLTSLLSLMRFYCFFCPQKDAKQCCDATKMGCTYCSGRLLT